MRRNSTITMLFSPRSRDTDRPGAARLELVAAVERLIASRLRVSNEDLEAEATERIEAVRIDESTFECGW